MAKNRDRQKMNKKVGQVEERLNSKTEWSTKDPTPQEAVNNIIEASK